MNRGVVAGVAAAVAGPSPVPPGIIWEYAGVALPDPATYGVWLWADGSLVSKAQYPALFGAIGFSHSPTPGTDPGGGNFYLPSRKGKVGVGVDASQIEFDTLGETGGSKTTTAPHSHSLSAHSHTLSTTSISDNTSDWPSDNTSDGGSGTTNWQSDNHSNYQHFHIASFVRVVYQTSGAGHAHAGGANTASEGVSGGIYYGGALSIDVNTTDTNHWHGTSPHSHGMKNHTHTMKNHTHSGTSSGPSGGDVSGASSAGAASGNLPPYLAMNYLIKT